MDRGRRRLDRLFSFALVILSVLATAEFQFVCSIPDREAEIPYAFRVLSYPIFALMILWLIKEVMFTRVPRGVNWKMAFTEFCWDLWSSTLFIYLILYQLFAYGNVNLIVAVLIAVLTGLLALLVSIGYQRTEPGMVYFRRRRRRIIRTIFIFSLAYGFTILLFSP